MAIFDKPDFEKMLQNADWPRLIHYANYTKDPELSREAMKVATRDPYKLVEYLYETALWTQKNAAAGAGVFRAAACGRSTKPPCCCDDSAPRPSRRSSTL